MLNVHASMLPKLRGAAPIIYAIKEGLTETGVSIMKIKPKYFDIGEVSIVNTLIYVTPNYEAFVADFNTEKNSY